MPKPYLDDKPHHGREDHHRSWAYNPFHQGPVNAIQKESAASSAPHPARSPSALSRGWDALAKGRRSGSDGKPDRYGHFLHRRRHTDSLLPDTKTVY